MTSDRGTTAISALALSMLTLAFVLTAHTRPAAATDLSGQSTSASEAQNLCGAPAPGQASCLGKRQTRPLASAARHQAGRLAVSPATSPGGLAPADLADAYDLDQTKGAGQTVAIIDAFDDPTAEADLAVYRSQFGLPACTTANGCFAKVNQNGSTGPLPSPDTGWAGEISLDLDMVSATCPLCKILLVEADSSYLSDLGQAVDTAVSMGAKFVSNSYGGPEYGGVTGNDMYFNHPGVAITVSSGDSGYGVSYPASSSYVTAVGGTTLSRSAATRGWTETAWAGAGSGCSGYSARPTAQAGLTGCANRAVSDVAAVADPSTGVAVYSTYGDTGWGIYGGTSAAAPIIASVYALAGTPGANDYPNTYPYEAPGSLYDQTSGSNGSCSVTILCTATSGWDGPTGLGSPNTSAAFGSAIAQPAAEPTTITANAGTTAMAYGTTVPVSGTLQLSSVGVSPLLTGSSILIKVKTAAGFTDSAGSASVAADGTWTVNSSPKVSGELWAIFEGSADATASSYDIGPITVGSWTTKISLTTQLKSQLAGASNRVAGSASRAYGGQTLPARGLPVKVYLQRTSGLSRVLLGSTTTNSYGAYALYVAPNENGTIIATVNGVTGYTAATSPAIGVAATSRVSGRTASRLAAGKTVSVVAGIAVPRVTKLSLQLYRGSGKWSTIKSTYTTSLGTTTISIPRVPAGKYTFRVYFAGDLRGHARIGTSMTVLVS